MKIFSVILVATALLAQVAAEESPNARRLGRSNGDKRGKDSSSCDSSSSDSSSSDSSSSCDEYCRDPAGAVLEQFKCFEEEDIDCITGSYDPDFQTIHNEIVANTNFLVTSTDFWTASLLALDFSFDVKFSYNVGPNQASVRYVQSITTTGGEPFDMTGYPFNQSFVQHEHAIVTVDDDCKLVEWNQYGDNQEQTDVVVATGDLLCAIGVGTNCDPV